MSQRDEAYKQAKQNDEVQGWKNRLQYKGKSDVLEPTLSNVSLLFEFEPEWQGLFRQDLFTHEIELTREPPYPKGEQGLVREDYDITRIRRILQERYKVHHLGESELIKSMQAVAFENGHHPVRDYLDGLEWDGSPRLDCMLEGFLGAVPVGRDAEGNLPFNYVRRVSAIWMLQAVRRIYEPGCKADYVLILEGPQRLGKSTFLSLLAGPWFMDTPFQIGDKDGYQALQGKWIIELAELDSFNKAEATRAKAFFSSSTDRFRVAYGRNVQEFPRQCVFAGSTNQHEYLQDSTGNLRYMPVLCTRFDRTGPDGLEANVDQLWAEAVHRYKAGEQTWPTDDDLLLFEQQQAIREIPDLWELLIEQHLNDPEVVGSPERDEAPAVTMSQLAKDALHLEPRAMLEKQTSMRIGRIMHKLGWVKKQATTQQQRQKLGRFFYTPKTWNGKRVS